MPQCEVAVESLGQDNALEGNHGNGCSREGPHELHGLLGLGEGLQAGGTIPIPQRVQRGGRGGNMGALPKGGEEQRRDAVAIHEGDESVPVTGGIRTWEVRKKWTSWRRPRLPSGGDDPVEGGGERDGRGASDQERSGPSEITAKLSAVISPTLPDFRVGLLQTERSIAVLGSCDMGRVSVFVAMIKALTTPMPALRVQCSGEDAEIDTDTHGCYRCVLANVSGLQRGGGPRGASRCLGGGGD